MAETRSKTAVAGGGNEPPPAQAPSAAFLLGSYPNVLWSSGELIVSETCWGVSWDPNRPLLSGANFLGATSTIAGNAFSYGADYATYEPNGDVYMDPLVAAAHGWNLYAPDYNSGGFDFCIPLSAAEASAMQIGKVGVDPEDPNSGYLGWIPGDSDQIPLPMAATENLGPAATPAVIASGTPYTFANLTKFVNGNVAYNIGGKVWNVGQYVYVLNGMYSGDLKGGIGVMPYLTNELAPRPALTVYFSEGGPADGNGVYPRTTRQATVTMGWAGGWNMP